MMKYPFTPEMLDALPEELAELYRGLEDTLLEEICSRLRISGELNEVTVQDIRALRSHGIDLEEIEKAIAEAAQVSQEELAKLFAEVVERNQAYYTELIDLAKVTAPDTLVDAAAVEAISRQTAGELRNITGSMGFIVRRNGKKVLLPPGKSYQWALDQALLQVESGAVSYDRAIASAVKELAGSGLKTVNYESGHVDQVDVAARRAVMTGVNQVNQKYREQSMEYLETDLVEVTAHGGARNTGSGYLNHAEWQGKIYHWRKYGDKHRGKYPDFEEICGYGQGGGIGGWNCRHSYWPFNDGIMDPSYTAKELAEIDQSPFEYEGRTYDAYQATQKQREIERTIRREKRLMDAYKAAGLPEDEQNARIRLRRLNEKYREFSRAAGLPEQRERMRVLYVDAKSEKAAAIAIEKRVQSGIIRPIQSNEIPGVNKVCDLDIEKYKCVTPDITTKEVIITDERIEHIKDHHPGHFEEIEPFLKSAIESPDFILKDAPNTGLILKQIQEEGLRMQMVLRLHTSADSPQFLNSIISAWKISESRWKNYLRSKKILYKSE